MSEAYLAFFGFLIIFAVIAFLMWGKIHPIVAMVIIPVIGALIAGFGFDELREFFSGGTDQVINVAIMFIFAIIFFGIMNDVGLFNPIIKNLIILTRGNVIIVCIVTIIVGAIATLTGLGRTTYLLTIPALIGLYKQLNMSPMLLLMLATFSLGFMNVVPWGGPVGRIARCLGMITRLNYGTRLSRGKSERYSLRLALRLFVERKKRIKRRIDNGEIQNTQNIDSREIADDFIKQQKENQESSNEKRVKHPAMIWMNALLLVGVLLSMLLDILPPAMAFMIGLAIALPLNYRTVDDQMGRIRAHAPAALMMASIILAAGLFLGVITDSGMLDALALSIVGVMPDAIGPYLHIVVAFFGIPLDIIMSTDAYYYGIFPVVESVASSFGVPSESTAFMLLIGSTFSQVLSPALWLGVGLAGVQIGRFMKYAFFWFWGFAIIGLIFGFIIGVY
ncbi:LOW QUALITY PROTEIN: magnesium citrate secondary transporter [Geomicrobium sp. JCM 19037]|nr:LOW QUALITY PROTEIN: magnesium citrate secondary transporter [Geomicrobium sp. JCM 19037]